MNVARRILMASTLAIIVTAPTVAAHASSVYVQRKVESQQFPVRSACFMPPAAGLTKLGMKSAERMVKESNDWADALQALVENHLKSDGISVDVATNPLTSGASDNEIQQVIEQIEQKYDSVFPLMDKKPGEIAKSAYTLGDQVAMLPCAANSDVLVFVRAGGTVTTEGRETFSVLVGGPISGAVFIVTFADAKTGEILGLIRLRRTGNFLESAEKSFGPDLDNNLSNMNIGSARKNAKAGGH
jgi:hypothetical protein